MDCDTIFCILRLLSPLDIWNCASLNKQFDMVSKSEIIWKEKCEINLEITENYCASYKLEYFLKMHGMSISKGLLRISLINKGVKSLPKEIMLLTNIKYLNLYGNKLKSIPREISSLTDLHTLDLSCNLLEFVPKEIGSLTDLTVLDLHHNKIQSILCEIHLLTNLVRLSLNHNELIELPKKISFLTNLQKLEIDENQSKSVPHNLFRAARIIGQPIHNQFLVTTGK